MANRLTMAEIDRIHTLHTTAHSNREIADLLGINRETVGKYVTRAKAQNQPKAPSGSNGSSPSGNNVGGSSEDADFDNDTAAKLVAPSLSDPVGGMAAFESASDAAQPA